MSYRYLCRLHIWSKAKIMLSWRKYVFCTVRYSFSGTVNAGYRVKPVMAPPSELRFRRLEQQMTSTGFQSLGAEWELRELKILPVIILI